MKKIIVLLSLFLLTPSSVFADEQNITTGDRSVSVRIEQRINTVKNNIEERKEIRIENREENREERREEFALRHAERLSKRFTEYYERLTKIIKKVELKIVGVSEAITKLNEVKAKLESAKKLGDEAVALFKSLTVGNLGSSNSEVETAKNKAEEARKAYMEVLKLVKETIKLARGVEK